jgi:hypothetical protein
MNLIYEGKLEVKGLTFYGVEPTPMLGSQPVSPAITTSFNSSSGNTHLSALLRQNGSDLDVSGPINGAHEQTIVESEDKLHDSPSTPQLWPCPFNGRTKKFMTKGSMTRHWKAHCAPGQFPPQETSTKPWPRHQIFSRYCCPKVSITSHGSNRPCG